MQNTRNTVLYVINGFLESGKTTFIRNAIIRDPNIVRERVVLICCEEGEIDYGDDLPDCINVVNIEDPDELTERKMLEINREFRPTYVIIEYNAIWGMKKLYDIQMPVGWDAGVQFTIIDPGTFDSYFNNMKSIFADMLRESSQAFVNRCGDDTDFSSLRAGIKSCNPSIDIVYTGENDMVLDVRLEEDLPYDINADIIEIKPDDYATWYIDVLDNVERYIGKTVEYTAFVTRPAGFSDGCFLGGNMVITCCEDDKQFFGFVCKYDDMNRIHNGVYLKMRAEVQCEFAPEYNKEGPVMYVKKITKMPDPNAPKKKKK